MNNPLDRTLAAAITEGLLPADAARSVEENRPWPVILLTALGAWLAAIPLIGVIGLLFGDLLSRDAAPYLAGILILAAAVGILRSRDLSLFVEQLAVPALLVGLGSLAFAIARDLPDGTAATILGFLSLGIAVVLPRQWIRVLLGAAAAALLTFALTLVLSTPRAFLHAPEASRVWAWLALHLALIAWLIGLRIQRNLLGRGNAAAAETLESIGAGWLLLTLAGLALLSGMTLLVGAVLHPEFRGLTEQLSNETGILGPLPWVPFGSSLLVLIATIRGARTWPSLRRPWVLGVGAGMAALAWLLPSLGGVWLALIVTATSSRPLLAGSAALAAAWIIGSFYYQLHWPLAHKALALAAVGILFGTLVWLGARLGRGRKVGAVDVGPRGGPAPWLIALTLLATLAVANIGIWQKETLIADGRPVYVELAPVDPRSLIQGDFMRLRFRIPGRIDNEIGLLAQKRPRVIARCDARGVATLLRLQGPQESLTEGEFLMELIPKNGRLTLVTDAWFFREGDAARWQAARYGEFRVTPDGKALLIGMADNELRPIEVEE